MTEEFTECSTIFALVKFLVLLRLSSEKAMSVLSGPNMPKPKIGFSFVKLIIPLDVGGGLCSTDFFQKLINFTTPQPLPNISLKSIHNFLSYS